MQSCPSTPPHSALSAASFSSRASRTSPFTVPVDVSEPPVSPPPVGTPSAPGTPGPMPAPPGASPPPPPPPAPEPPPPPTGAGPPAPSRTGQSAIGVPVVGGTRDPVAHPLLLQALIPPGGVAGSP